MDSLYISPMQVTVNRLFQFAAPNFLFKSLQLAIKSKFSPKFISISNIYLIILWSLLAKGSPASKVYIRILSVVKNKSRTPFPRVGA